MKLSHLLEVSLANLRQCEVDPHFRINMGVFFLRVAPEDCLVCLGGAYMAKSLAYSPYADVAIHDMPDYERHCVEALDALAFGQVTDALLELDQFKNALDGLTPVTIPPYEVDPVGFKHKLHALAGVLREKDL